MSLRQTRLDTYFSQRTETDAAMTSSSDPKRESSTSHSTSSKSRPRSNKSDPRRALRAVAAETKRVLPGIIRQLPHNYFASTVHDLNLLPAPDPAKCPGHIGTQIHVLDIDSYDAALALLSIDANTPVSVLNLASEKNPGGGWENGALAQEEAMCYRSSLYLSLPRKYYPLKPLEGVFSPHVVIIRESMASGHHLLDVPTDELPHVSVISVAAPRRPAIAFSVARYEDGDVGEETYANPRDRHFLIQKIRLTLRMSIHEQCTRLVLGAMGCGAFKNPVREVARCFKEVFAEQEFQGGWWADVVFAVMDNVRPGSGKKGGKEGEGNFGVFWRELNGLEV